MRVDNRRFLNNFKTTLTSSWGTSGGASLPPIATVEMAKLLAATVNGEHIIVTLSNTDDTVIEVIKLIRGASVFTSERGQEGTTAVSWASGSKISVRLTADTLNQMVIYNEPFSLGTLLNYRFPILSYVTVDLDALLDLTWSPNRVCNIDLTNDTNQIRFTSVFRDIFWELFFRVSFAGGSVVPTVQLNGVTKTPTGTAPTNGTNYFIKVTYLGSLGVRLEYLTKS